MREPFKYVAQPRIGFLAVDLCGLDQAVDLGTGGRTLGRITEQPRLAPYNKRFYCALGSIVVYALTRRMSSVGANPTRLVSLRPEALWSSSGGNEWAEVSEEKASLGSQ